MYETGIDSPFERVLADIAPRTDTDLAELIEADGRARVRLNLEVRLDRYLRGVSNLHARLEPLDAAIDVALRSLIAQGCRPEDAVHTLVGQHPALEGLIREAVELGDLVLSTSSLHQVLIDSRAPRQLPEDFGPLLPDGRRRYQLTALLGSGSGGEVYRAADRQLSEPGHDAVVAVKTLGVSETPWARQRFIEEATKARRILSPHVVRVMDRGGDETTPDFIVYEYVPGGDLQRYGTEHPRLSQDEVVRLITEVARGVEAAHAAGVVHCDLKPSNIVLTDEGTAKVADFGIAVRRDARGPDRAPDTDGAPVGNLAFIAPEQYRMEAGAHVPAADIYAIGGIMYWLATASLPNGRTPSEIERTHNAETGRRVAPSLRTARPEFDRELDLICARCMASEPSHRYASAAQLAEDLAAWQRREPIPWTRPTIRRALVLWTRRKPGVAASVLALVLTVVGASVATSILWHESAVASATLRARDQERTENARKLRFVHGALKALESKGEAWESLPLLPYIEWAQGTSTLGDPTNQIPVWQERIEIIRDMHQHALRVGGPNDFEALCLETTLAFWLICDDQYEAGAALLAGNRSRWARLAPEFTRWQTWIDALALCAEIGGAAEESERDSGSPAVDLDKLTAASRTLTDVRAQLTTGPMQRALQGLIDRSLYKLYGPALLNEPELAKRYAPPDKSPRPSLLGRIKAFF